MTNLTLARWDEICTLAPGVPRRCVRRWLRGGDVLLTWHTQLSDAATTMSLTSAESPARGVA